jgi:chaperonin cofactor prefoldin
MTEAVTVAIVTGVLAIVGEIIIAVVNNKAMMAEMKKQTELADARLEKAQAITDTKLDELTREVRSHNNFAQRMPVVEEQIKVANHRIADLEQAMAK